MMMCCTGSLAQTRLGLCVSIEQQQIAGKTVHSIGAGALLACLDEHISAADAEPLALGMAQWREQQGTATETTAVFRDSAFENDVAKSNLAAILEQRREARAQLVKRGSTTAREFHGDSVVNRWSPADH